MKILFSQFSLNELGGSSLFVVESACALAREGHQVAVYAAEPGTHAGRLAREGVAYIDDPRACPWVPDVIHGQHRRFALDCLLAFPHTPALLYCHGMLPWKERPFLHPRVLAYVTTAPVLADHLIEKFTIPSDRIHVVPNHIDVDRFAKVRDVAEKPSRALLFSNNFFENPDLKCLEEACSHQGLTLDFIGQWIGGCDAAPERRLPDYDVVFAIGRSALEAAACGCAVIPVCGSMAEEMILPGCFEKFRSQNFSMRISKHEKLTTEWVVSQLAKWSPEDVREVTRRVRGEARIETTTRRLHGIYSAVMEEFPRVRFAPGDEVDALDTFFEAEHIHSRRRFPGDAKHPVLEGGGYDIRAEYESLAGLLGDAMEKRRIAETNLLQMTGSLSWTITAPLRALHQVLHRTMRVFSRKSTRRAGAIER